MRLVIDTNVFISALLIQGSLPALLIELRREGRFDLLTAADELDELMRVTRYPTIRERLAPPLVVQRHRQGDGLRVSGIGATLRQRVQRGPHGFSG